MCLMFTVVKMKFIMISFCCVVILALLTAEVLSFSCSRDDPQIVKGYLADMKSLMIERFKTFIFMAEKAEVDTEELSVKVLSKIEKLINEFKSCQFDFIFGRLVESYKHSSNSSAKLKRYKRIRRQSLSEQESDESSSAKLKRYKRIRRQSLSEQESAESSSAKLERYKRIRRRSLSEQESAESSGVSQSRIGSATPVLQDEQTAQVDDHFISGVAQKLVDYVLADSDLADPFIETVVDHVHSSSPTLETVVDHVLDSGSEDSMEQVLDVLDEISLHKRAGIIRGPGVSQSRIGSATPVPLDEQTAQVNDHFISGVAEKLVDYVLADSDHADPFIETVLDHVNSSSPILATVVDHVLDSGSEDSVEQVLDVLDEISLQKRAGIICVPLPPRPSISEIRRQFFPDYESIPETGFTCDGKKYIPGFYADMETDCQVFHVCWPRRKESYLCPFSTTFNQKKLTCDRNINSDCSLSPLYYHYNEMLYTKNKPEELFKYDDPTT